MKKIFCFFFVSLFVSACTARIVYEPFEQSREFTEQGLTTTYIFAKGKTLMNPSISGFEKRISEAQETALENARANMLSLIEGSYINESLMVSRLVEGDAFLESQISTVIEQNSRTIRKECTKTDCFVIIRLPREALKAVGITLVK